MDCKDLKKWQVDQISASVRNGLRYLSKLRNRMDQTFMPDDELFVKVRKAHDAMHSLCGELHYLSCSHGVGRPEKK